MNKFGLYFVYSSAQVCGRVFLQGSSLQSKFDSYIELLLTAISS